MDERTISPTALHYGGLYEYNVHRTYGFLMGIASNHFLKERSSKKQPFIISRSTLWGSGKWNQLWTGDNFSEWPWLKVSIAQIMSFNLFGIPFVGSDICGFLGDTNAELCAR